MVNMVPPLTQPGGSAKGRDGAICRRIGQSVRCGTSGPGTGSACAPEIVDACPGGSYHGAAKVEDAMRPRSEALIVIDERENLVLSDQGRLLADLVVRRLTATSGPQGNAVGVGLQT